VSIEYLRLKGFKSFGTTCEFTFGAASGATAPFTAIVGPNGSGKSNILDALRWILGEASPAALRITRQSDLIFQGSETVERAREADVTLKLRSGGEGDNTLEDRASLRRQYTVENGSSLTLDGTKIRIQDLADLKTRFQLSGDSFAFIGQGEIAEVIHQRPMQRRHHLELLFGIERYRRKRDETYIKLEEARAELESIKNITAELEARRAEIAPLVERAVEAKGILDELDQVRRDFYFFRRMTLERKEKEHRHKLQLLTLHTDAAAKWHALWRKVLQDAEGVAAPGAAGSTDGNFSLLLSRERALADSQQKRDQLRRASFATATTLRGLLDSRSELLREGAELNARLAEARQELEQAEALETELRREAEEKRAAFDEAQRRAEANRSEIEKQRRIRTALRDERAEQSVTAGRLESRLKAVTAHADAEQAQAAARAMDADTALAAKLESEAAALAKQHETLSAAHADAYAAYQKIAARLQQQTRALVSMEAELEAMKGEPSDANAMYPEPVRFLLSAARLGRLNSELALVAEVFSCELEAATAIDAYLGGRAFWFLVRTMNEAQEGIEMLKRRERGGRVTYLPLENSRPRSPDRRIINNKKSDTVGWAADLITVQAPWEPALMHLLGDLLIVRTYQAGSELVRAGARCPIATLEGEVFSPAGTVSGGAKGSRGEGAISRNRRITELSMNIDGLKKNIAALKSDEAEKKEKKAFEEREKTGTALERLKVELAAVNRSIAARTAEIERLNKEQADAAAESEDIRAQLERIAARISEIDASMKELGEPCDEETLDAEGGSQSSQSSQKSELNILIERLRSSETITARMRKEEGELERRAAACASEVAAGREREAELRKRLSELGRESFAAWQNTVSLSAEIEDLRAQNARRRRRLERARAKERTSEQACAAANAEAAAVKERAEQTAAEIAQLIEEYDEIYPYDARAAVRIMDDEAEQRGQKTGLASERRRLERELKALGPYNLGALSEDESLTERLDYYTEQSEDVQNGIDELKRFIDEVDAQVEEVFSRSMKDIDLRFNALFKRLFGPSGEAHLTLASAAAADSESGGTGGGIWDRGVEITAQPPGKVPQSISQLSGGEQSLTAVAHLFAALDVAKMPLAVLDEVDAALDEYNLIRFADLAKEYSKSIQLIVMTHRRTTMERADLIYGVTMVEPGLSKIVGIDVENYI
jgi:chromosome segregation protein